MSLLLEVKDISVSFRGLIALDKVSISVASGEFVGLMGPNGAGKTSVLNCISRIQDVKNGTIVFNGLNLLNLPAHEVVRLGISRTFQDLNFFNINPEMSISDYMCLGLISSEPGSIFKDGFQFFGSLKTKKLLKFRIRRILEFFADIREQLEDPQEVRGYPALFGREGFPDLLDIEHSPIGNLSFAWRRRLDLARALVSSPKLLLLDEPAQGLPPSEISNLGKILKSIQSEFNLAALIVEHNIETLMSISQRIVVLDHGKKIVEGIPEQVRAHPEVIQTYFGASKKDPIESANTNQSANVFENKIPVLEAKNLDVFYGNAQSLFSVSVKLYPRQISCVLGTNGSGKSTLLKTISGLEEPAVGEIFLDGSYLPHARPEIAAERGMQYVPQGHLLFPRLTVKENLRIGGLILSKKGIKPDIERAYHYFPQLKETNCLAADLSGGQQQMLAIAQALMAQPKVLLLDEPSLGLSPHYVDLLFQIIRKIADEEKCSIFIVEQSVAHSLNLSHYVYLLSSGVIVAEGTSEIFRKDTSLIRKNLGFY